LVLDGSAPFVPGFISKPVGLLKNSGDFIFDKN